MVSITLDGGLRNGWFGLWPLAADVLTGQIVVNYLLEIICSIFFGGLLFGLWHPLGSASGGLFIIHSNSYLNKYT